ncbi:hypothetical protein NXS19_007875 [Fusarium pseudograminearum]|nr:hypothetical protein NXS19_007875 [Fusarium pseudograminearum]
MLVARKSPLKRAETGYVLPPHGEKISSPQSTQQLNCKHSVGGLHLVFPQTNISGDDTQEFPSCIGTALLQTLALTRDWARASVHITPDSYPEMSERHGYKCSCRVLNNDI